MGFNRIAVFFLLIIALGFFSYYYPAISESLSNNSITSQTIQEQYEKEPAILVRVIDGDTIVVSGDKIGNETHIRLLGINTPEKKMPFSNESKAFLQQFENKTILLQRDWEDTDKYKRKLRYLFFEDRLLNKEILEKGYANTYYISGLKYQAELVDAENKAKSAQVGIWIKSPEICSTSSCIAVKELNYTAEFFTITNQCNFPCSLEGWFVKDAGRSTFYLSSLGENEEKTYNSKTGTEVWNNEGDRLFMFDKKGYLVLFYEY